MKDQSDQITSLPSYYESNLATIGIEAQTQIVIEKNIAYFTNKILSCPTGKDNSEMYEDIMIEALQTIISNDFHQNIVLEKLTSHTVGNLRFKRVRDICLPIDTVKLESNELNIWTNLKQAPFESRSIIIDCKNYDKEEIGSNEVYQVYEYLNPKLHGRVGMILTRDNATISNSAIQSIKRLKLDNYFIVIMKDADIIDWVRSFYECGNAKTYFYARWQRLIIEYE